jgi:hypothetical protein
MRDGLRSGPVFCFYWDVAGRAVPASAIAQFKLRSTGPDGKSDD